jgi:uncharacterized membrane protein
MLKSSLCLAVALSLFGCSRSALELGEVDDDAEAPHAGARPGMEPSRPSPNPDPVPPQAGPEPGEPPPPAKPPPVAKPPYHWDWLGDMPGSFSTEWSALSADGAAVAGLARFHDGVNVHIAALVWTYESGVRPLDPAPMGDAYLNAAGADSRSFGGTSTQSGGHAPFLWRDGVIEHPEATGELKGVSADLRFIVGTYLSRPDYNHGFLWSRETGQVDLGTIGDEEQSSALAVSADGRIVIGESGGRAFRWTRDDGADVLELPAGDSRSEARDISGDGSVIAGRSTTFERSDWTPLLWIDGVPRPLDVLAPLEDNAVNAVTPDGRVAVGKSGEAAIWSRDGKVRSLRSELSRFSDDANSYDFSEALDVSADGSVVFGKTIRDDGTTEFFLAWL